MVAHYIWVKQKRSKRCYEESKMKFKQLRETFLAEAMSKPMTMRDVKAIEKKYNEKMSQDEIDDYLENNFSPVGSARPDAWLSLGYPVRRGDYYFALIGQYNLYLV